MKKSEQLLNLSLINIEDGKVFGNISDLVINPTTGSVEYLIVSNDVRYSGVKVLPFKHVAGVGDDAVTIESINAVADFVNVPEISSLLEKNIQVKGIKVLTKKGTIIGTVTEFIIDDENAGKIMGCQLTGLNGEISGIIPTEEIITYGKEVLIVNNEVKEKLVDNLASSERLPKIEPTIQTDTLLEEKEVDVEETKENVLEEPTLDKRGSEESQEEEPLKLFEQKQREYLLGRKVTKRIQTENEETIAEEGDEITDKILDAAKAADKLTELTMNTRA